MYALWKRLQVELLNVFGVPRGGNAGNCLDVVVLKKQWEFVSDTIGDRKIWDIPLIDGSEILPSPVEQIFHADSYWMFFFVSIGPLVFLLIPEMKAWTVQTCLKEKKSLVKKLEAWKYLSNGR